MRGCIKFPRGDDLNHVVDESKTKWGVSQDLALLMDGISPFALPVNNTQIITTENVGTL